MGKFNYKVIVFHSLVLVLLLVSAILSLVAFFLIFYDKNYENNKWLLNFATYLALFLDLCILVLVYSIIKPIPREHRSRTNSLRSTNTT